MPFDNLPIDYPELRAFRDKLRDPGQWPEGFAWDFSKCRRCALGMLGAVPSGQWGTGWEPYREAARMLGISLAHTDWLFSGYVAGRRKIPASKVTPEMVADDIDYLLANGL